MTNTSQIDDKSMTCVKTCIYTLIICIMLIVSAISFYEIFSSCYYINNDNSCFKTALFLLCMCGVNHLIAVIFITKLVCSCSFKKGFNGKTKLLIGLMFLYYIIFITIYNSYISKSCITYIKEKDIHLWYALLFEIGVFIWMVITTVVSVFVLICCCKQNGGIEDNSETKPINNYKYNTFTPIV